MPRLDISEKNNNNLPRQLDPSGLPNDDIKDLKPKGKFTQISKEKKE